MIYNLFAEREGFEPPVPLSTTVFKTAAIDHSAISPKPPFRRTLFKSAANLRLFFVLTSLFRIFFIKSFFENNSLHSLIFI